MTLNGDSLPASRMARERLEWASLTEPPPFLRDGVAADWRQSTVDLVFANYRPFLGWLDSASLYHVDEHASARITQETAVLYDLGVRLMRANHRVAGPTYRQQATIFRDGLQIALLSQRPLRRKNFAEMELERHLRRDGGWWRLSYDAEETKNGLAIDCEIPVEHGGKHRFQRNNHIGDRLKRRLRLPDI